MLRRRPATHADLMTCHAAFRGNIWRNLLCRTFQETLSLVSLSKANTSAILYKTNVSIGMYLWWACLGVGVHALLFSAPAAGSLTSALAVDLGYILIDLGPHPLSRSYAPSQISSRLALLLMIGTTIWTICSSYSTSCTKMILRKLQVIARIVIMGSVITSGSTIWGSSGSMC